MAVERIALPGKQRTSSAGAVVSSGQIDTVLVGTLIVLVSLGTLVLFSASYAVGIRDVGDGLYFLRRQLVFLAVGVAVLLVTARVDYHFWRRFSVPAMAGTALLMLAVLPLGSTVFGARRWFALGPVQMQPSEIMKFVLILYMADLLDRKGSRIRHFLNGAAPFAIILSVILFLVMLEPDLGTATVLAVIGISVFLIAGADIRQLGLFLLSGAGAFALLALTAPYRRERLLLFLHPERDLRDAGWQLWQARIALGDGGVFGLGLGASRQKFSWLPAAHTDAIFAVIGEELGLVGCAVVLGLFAALAVRGYRTAMRAPDRFGAIVATGITTWIVFQSVINIGGVTTAIPFTGVPLPLFSYGGSSLVVTLGALGVLINISRWAAQPKARVRRAPSRVEPGDD
jgi:cell division protein FtsW